MGVRRVIRRLAGPAAPLRTATMTAPVADSHALHAQIAYNPFGGFCVPSASAARPSAQRILRGEVWEPGTLDLIAGRATTGDVVHAGAYFGDFLPALSRSVGPDGRVWAYEPNAENHRCAQITILLNDLRNVELHHAGLGAAGEVGHLLVSDSDGNPLGGGSRFTPADAADPARSTEATIVTIDDTVPVDRPVAVIQLDVEGFEDEALRGARGTIERCLPMLVIERRPSQAILDELLTPLGYGITDRVHMNTVLMVDDAV